MRGIGKTVVVGKLLGANDVSAQFEINGKEYDIEAIEDQGDFLSPLNRTDENGTKTMKDYLMHPRKSAKRKLKVGDYVLLTLQKYITKEKSLVYKLQNAVTYQRVKNVQDDLEYKGLVFNVSDVQEFVKKEESLPLFLIKYNTFNNQENKTKIVEDIKTIIIEGVVPYINISYKVDEDSDFEKFRVVKNKIENVEDTQMNIEEFEEFISKQEDFQASFFINATKQYNVADKYNKIFRNNAVSKKPKTDLDILTNEDLESFFEPTFEEIDNNDTFKGKKIFGKSIGDKNLQFPSIISIKQSYNSDEESFFLLSSVIPDIIAIRKRAKDYIKSKLEEED